MSPALIRPGRVDLRVKFDYASTYQIRLMVERLFPFTRSPSLSSSLSSPSPSSPSPISSSSDSLPPSSSILPSPAAPLVEINEPEGEPHSFTQSIMNGIGERVVTTAQLQDWFIKNLKSSPENILNDIPRFVASSKEDNKNVENSWDMMMAMHDNPIIPPPLKSQATPTDK